MIHRDSKKHSLSLEFKSDLKEELHLNLSQSNSNSDSRSSRVIKIRSTVAIEANDKYKLCVNIAENNDALEYDKRVHSISVISGPGTPSTQSRQPTTTPSAF